MADKHRLIFEPLGRTVAAESGISILEAAQEAEIPLRADCGGLGVCGKCLVLARPEESLSAPTEVESEEIGSEDLESGFRLACQASVTGPLTIILPDGIGEQRSASGKTGLQGTYPIQTGISRTILADSARLSLEETQVGDLVERLAGRLGRAVEIGHPSVLRDLAGPEAATGPVTLVEDQGRGVIAVHSGIEARSWGLAVDLGTTTVAAYLADLGTGRILGAEGEANPQRRFGEDVISRIAKADTGPEGLESLRSAAVEAINGLVSRLTQRFGGGPELIDRMVLVGNTTMQQLFAGIHPQTIGRAPYLPAIRSGLSLRAGDLGLAINPGIEVFLFPVISGFVGGDAVAATLAEQARAQNSGETLLVIDIGTNGELVLISGDRAWATSCATGPALEGAHISHGVRAVKGAIHRVEPGEPFACRLLGGPDQPAVGICGTGLIDSIAVLRQADLILPTGRFNDDRDEVIKDEKGIGRRIELIPAEATKTGSPISLELADIRQVQLAKAALLTGINYLLERAGLETVDRTVLTGAFGSRFDWPKAVAVGLLPPELGQGRIEAVENAAGTGAVLALLDDRRRAEAERLAREIRVVELSREPDFNNRFAAATVFPRLEKEENHADPDRHPD